MTPQRLTPNPHSQFCNGWFQLGPNPPPTPALLQRIWTPPKVSTVFFANASTESAFDTSVTTPSTVAPLLRISVSAWRKALSSTSARTTFRPAAANRSANARPMPLAAPVTTATRALNSFIGLAPPVISLCVLLLKIRRCLLGPLVRPLFFCRRSRLQTDFDKPSPDVCSIPVQNQLVGVCPPAHGFGRNMYAGGRS